VIWAKRRPSAARVGSLTPGWRSGCHCRAMRRNAARTSSACGSPWSPSRRNDRARNGSVSRRRGAGAEARSRDRRRPCKNSLGPSGAGACAGRGPMTRKLKRACSSSNSASSLSSKALEGVPLWVQSAAGEDEATAPGGRRRVVSTWWIRPSRQTITCRCSRPPVTSWRYKVPVTRSRCKTPSTSPRVERSRLPGNSTISATDSRQRPLGPRLRPTPLRRRHGDGGVGGRGARRLPSSPMVNEGS
jgi:hypothetical protein